MPHQHQYWLGFNLVHGIGPSRLRGIYSYFQNDLAAAWHADPHEFEQAGLDEVVIQNLLERRRTLNLDGALKRLGELGARICTVEDPEYPRLLNEIPDAPPMFYYKGTLLPEDERALTIVGTRRATTYGRNTAYDLAYALAQTGLTIISGLALGIDAVAHQAALDAGGRTIAVLGNGIDSVYPAENQALADAVIAQGAIITELPPRTPPDAKHFPARNRIISGLALGVLVIEAPQRSGSLQTARLAADQGREVFAVPGNISNVNSHGTNALIQDGAKLVMQPEDVLEELNVTYRVVQTRHAVEDAVPEVTYDDELLRFIELEPLHIDEIAARSGLSVHEVAARFTVLELKELVEAVGPQTYGLKRKPPR